MQTVKALNIPNYGTPFQAQMPKKTTFLGITAQIDPNNANVKPRLVYLADSNFPTVQEQTYILLRGQSDLDHPEVKNWEFVGLTYDQNRRHNGIATLWKVQPINPIPVKVDANPKPKKLRQPHSPESLAAVKAHEDKLKLEEERQRNATHPATTPVLAETVLDGKTIEFKANDKNPLIEVSKEAQDIKDAVSAGIALKDLELKPLTSEAPSSSTKFSETVIEESVRSDEEYAEMGFLTKDGVEIKPLTAEVSDAENS